MPNPAASRIATAPSCLQLLQRQVAAVFRVARAWHVRRQQRARIRITERLLRELSPRDRSDLGIGPDQASWFAQGGPR